MNPEQGDDWKTIHRRGHRDFIGGSGAYWDDIGRLQFDFLRKQGLGRDHLFLDVACGSLRGGRRFIEFLDADRYLGIDKHIELIIYGVSAELGLDLYREKRPRFVVSDRFEFWKFGERPTFALAQSLFTHLTEADIVLCLTELRSVAAAGCRFFASFFEIENDDHPPNPDRSHSNWVFRYSRNQMEQFGASAGWKSQYIGPWDHPRNQNLIQFVAE